MKIQDGVCSMNSVVSNHLVRGVLVSFLSLTVLACSKPEQSNVIPQSPALLQTSAPQSIQKEPEQSIQKEPEQASDPKPEAIAANEEIAEGRYWLGGTGQGLEVQGDASGTGKPARYRYYSEGGEESWRPITELTAIKPGVVFDGQSYWCISTSVPATGATACSEHGWIEGQSAEPD